MLASLDRLVRGGRVSAQVVCAAALCFSLLACGGGGSQGSYTGGTAPSIATQPTNQAVTVGQTATFSVTATGTAPLRYQWQKGGVAISGATSASYTTPATQSSDDGTTFTVTVTNTVGSVSSSAATLTVTTTTPEIPPTTLSCAGFPQTVGTATQVCVILQEFAHVTPSLTVTTVAGNLTGHGQDNLQSFVVYARIVAQDANQGDATALANSVVINTANGNVFATPDQATAPQSLTVDFEVFTAQTTNLTLTDTTGNLAVDNYKAILNLTTATGNAVFSGVQGQEIVNVNTGNIEVTFTGTSFTGAGMTAKTQTGNVAASRPAGFQAAFTAETTGNGTASIDGQTQTAPLPNSPAIVTSGMGAPILLQTKTGNVTVTTSQ